MDLRLPEGVSLEMLDQLTAERYNRQRRECYARHPERVMRQRIVSAANLLQRSGYLDNDHHAAILARVRGGGADE